MTHELKVINKTENTITLNYKGYIASIYDSIQLGQIAMISSSNTVKGINIIVPIDKLAEILSAFREKQYIFDNAILNLDNECLLNVKIQNTKFIPKPYQLEDANRMYQAKKMLNASECGTGKTATAILAALKVENGRTLICAPSSLLLVWQYEIRRISPNERTKVIFTAKDWDNVGDEKWIICSYGQIKNYMDLAVTTFIIDEAHAIKACDWGKPASQRAKKVLEIAKNTEYVFALTATPMPNRVLEIYNIAMAVNAKEITFNANFSRFAKEFIGPKEKKVARNKTIIDLSGARNLDVLNAQLSKYMIRRLRRDVLPGISKIRQIVPIKPKLNSKAKITRETYISDFMVVRSEIAKAKVSDTVDLIDSFLEQKEKVVVFTCFLEPLEMITNEIQRKVEVAVIKGDMSADERADSINKFQNGDAAVCVVSLLAGGTGITLNSSHIVIFNDWSFTPSELIQAEDRVNRIGQKSNCCNIYYLVATNSDFDFASARIIEAKLENISQVVDGGNVKEEVFHNLFEDSIGSTM